MKEKIAVKDLHRALCRSLNGEAMALGILVDTDPVAVVERQIAGIDLERHPGWAEEAEANLDRLAELPLGERVFYLSVPLANSGKKLFSAQYAAAQGRIRAAVGLPQTHPGMDEVEFRITQAARVAEAIPAPFNPTPVSVAEQIWIATRSQRRGLVDMPPPDPQDTTTEALLVPKTGAALPEPILDEGAKSDLGEDRKTRAAFNPLTRRVLKIYDPTLVAQGIEDPASYQSMLVLADTPLGGMRFPGSEILGGLDEWGIDADWAVRLRITSREKVLARNRQAVRQLNDQYEQRESEQGLTGQHELDTSWQLLTEYQQIVSNDRLEVEVEHTIVLAVPGHNAQHAQEQAEALARRMNADSDLKVESPVGSQSDLWWSMQPGVPAGSIVRSYAQIATSDGFAMLTPFATTKLGGRTGPPLALNRSTYRPSVVHLNPGGYPELNISGSMAFVGVLGSGKSVAMKTVCSHILETGGQVLAIDKSAEGEWATLAGAFASSDRVVVDASDPKYSMDPLRVFGVVDGALIAQSTMTQMLDASPQEPRGQYLARVLSPTYLQAHDLTSLAQVMNHLDGIEHEHAQSLANHLRNFAEISNLGRLLFDDSLPTPAHEAPMVVWRTAGMAQPKENELATPHLYRNLPAEKIFGRAYYHLLVATAKRWAFQQRSRVVALACDEAYDITSNPQNAEYLEVFIREGRRAKALLLLAFHNPDTDLGSTTGVALIPTRIAFRCDNEYLAKLCTKFLGVPEGDPEFDRTVEDLMHNTSPVLPDVGVVPGREGECFIRDPFAGLGPAKILAPARAHVAAAVMSTPPKSGAVTAS